MPQCHSAVLLLGGHKGPKHWGTVATITERIRRGRQKKEETVANLVVNRIVNRIDRVVGQQGPWRLIERDFGHPIWRSLVLEHTQWRRKRGRKRIWYFGWNGERLARNQDAANLEQNWPEILAWVINQL